MDPVTARPSRGPGSGNRCGHDPARPRLELVDAKPHRHQFIADTQRRIRQLYSRGDVIPELGGRRSERREAVVLVLLVLVHHVDLRSLRVIVQRGETFEGLARKAVARRGAMTLSRVRRAISDLERFGLLLPAKQPREDYEGPDGQIRYKGLPARRKMTPRLWRELGRGLALERERKRAAQRWRETQAERAQVHAEHVRRQIRGVARRAAAAQRRPPGADAGDRQLLVRLQGEQLARGVRGDEARAAAAAEYRRRTGRPPPE